MFGFMQRMPEQTLDKKMQYFKVFDNKLSGSFLFHYPIRQLINIYLGNYNIPLFKQDQNLTEFLVEYIFTKKLALKEQKILDMIDELLKEQLVDDTKIIQLAYLVKRKQNISKLSKQYFKINNDNLNSILYDIYPYAETYRNVYEELQFDIQNYKQFELDTQEEGFHQIAIKIMNQFSEINSQVDDLDVVLNEIYENEKLNKNNYKILIEEEVELIKQIVSEMNLTQLLGLDKVFVCPYGSLVNGFSQNESDIDISINTNCYLDEILFLKLMYTFIENYFKKKQINYSQLILLDQARIPLIKLVKTNENLEGENKTVQIDICVNNVLGCLNSKMLYKISRIHHLIPKLGIIIKTWAKCKELINKNNLSSYAFILIMISFLQQQKYIDNSFQVQMQRDIQDQEQYIIQIKRNKEMKTEDFVTILYYVEKELILIKGLKDFKKNNPNQITILDVDLATLFEDFINYYSEVDNSNKRYINIISESKPNDYDFNQLFFSIIDPFDKFHNPGERSRVNDTDDNIYIKEFQNAQYSLMNYDYESIFKKNELQNNN